MTSMTAKRARKSPRTETIWAYHMRRMGTMRRTAAMESGSGCVGAGRGKPSGVSAGVEGAWVLVVLIEPPAWCGLGSWGALLHDTRRSGWELHFGAVG